jgi:hypothetical protein
MSNTLGVYYNQWTLYREKKKNFFFFFTSWSNWTQLTDRSIDDDFLTSRFIAFLRLKASIWLFLFFVLRCHISKYDIHSLKCRQFSFGFVTHIWTCIRVLIFPHSNIYVQEKLKERKKWSNIFLRLTPRHGIGDCVSGNCLAIPRPSAFCRCCSVNILNSFFSSSLNERQYFGSESCGGNCFSSSLYFK